MAQNVNPRPSGTTTFDKDAADRGSSTSSAQVSPKCPNSQKCPKVSKCLLCSDFNG